MEESTQPIAIEDENNPYYPFTKEESILGAADESYSAWNLYLSLQSSIQFADYKINLLFVIAGINLTIVIGSTQNFKTESILYQIFFILFLVVTIPFIYYSVKTIAAQTFSKPDVKSKKLYFFGEISSMPTSVYIKTFRSATRREHYDELLLQIHNLSNITREKFRTYGKALYLLRIMMALLVIILIVKALGK